MEYFYNNNKETNQHLLLKNSGTLLCVPISSGVRPPTSSAHSFGPWLQPIDFNSCTRVLQIQSFGLYPVEPKNNLTFDKKFYILTRRSFSMPLTRQNFFCSSEKSTLRQTEVGVSMSYYRDNSYEYLHQKWGWLSNNSLMPMLFP